MMSPIVWSIVSSDKFDVRTVGMHMMFYKKLDFKTVLCLPTSLTGVTKDKSCYIQHQKYCCTFTIKFCMSE
jgi:hypothetical protein